MNDQNKMGKIYDKRSGFNNDLRSQKKWVTGLQPPQVEVVYCASQRALTFGMRFEKKTV